MVLRKILVAYFILLTNLLNAQTSPELNSSQIKLKLQKLNVVGSVLYIAAHPDDENTRLLSYLANEVKVRTGYLSVTRGDGGQNLIGNEQSELLGIIRTQELLAARKVDGAEQFFTRANDFGFSKTADETFKIWDKEKILADVVWVIRKFRPDVIITRFPEDSRAGHGHHWASAVLAHEAFDAAADPKRFPEQLNLVKPWKATKLFWNTYNFGGNNTTSPDQIKLDVGNFNTLLGQGYGELAAESRSKHKSQGFGSAKSRGEQIEFLRFTAGSGTKTNLFEDIDFSWKRVENGEKIQQIIKKTNLEFDINNPSKSVKHLLDILAEVEKLQDSYWKTQKEKELKELILACSSLWFESYSSDPVHAIGDSIKLQHQFIVRSAVPVQLKQIKTTTKTLTENSVLRAGILNNASSFILADKITQPYWLNQKHDIGSYNVTDQQLIGHPENPDPASVYYTFSIEGKSITFKRPVVYKYVDPVEGEVYQPLTVAPPVTATINETVFMFTDDAKKKIKINLKSYADGIKGKVKINAPQGWKIIPESFDLDFARKNDEKEIEVEVSPEKNAENGTLTVSTIIGDKTFDQGLRTIKYSHIPVQILFPKAEAQLVNIDLKTNVKRIGYLVGAGDLIPESLKQIGFQVIKLSENNIQNSNLSDYDAIITGIRAYNVNDRMKYIQPKLMEYVKNGGTLLVQYNTGTSVYIGPYPFNISRERVTEENSKVTFLNPSHPLLNYPNNITEKDFEGWVQERGLYFVSDIDKNYTPLFEMGDSDGNNSAGSLITADFGKGKFVYTSLSFFRQLPAGVPGAYRLFVNLISKPD